MVKAKKAQLGELQSLVTGLLVVGIVITVGFLIMGGAKDEALKQDPNYGIGNACNLTSIGNCSSAVNGSLVTMQAMDTLTGWLPIIVITLIGAVLIGMVAMFRGRR